MTSIRTRVALVTGASGGMGIGITALFQESGWDVIAVDRTAPKSEVSLSIQANLADEHSIADLATKVRAKFAQVDVIVNNAAEQVVKPMAETPVEDWDRVMATNVRSLYLLATHLLEPLKAARGAIVNVASVHAIATSPGMAAYVASKGAVVALTRAMALELSPFAIRVNAVLPGAIDTPMLAAGMQRTGNAGAAMDALVKRHPLGRIGTPRDVAEAILFLADSTRSSFITGQTLIVDGGATARLSTE